ncbi:hypothetical protein [Ochrobactrum sp. Q0168]
MHTTSKPVSTAAIAFEDVLKGLSASISPGNNSNGCPGFEKKK